MKNDLVKYLGDLLLNQDDGLLSKLRIGEGLDKSKVDEICSILTQLAIEWENDDKISKEAVDYFIHIDPVMNATLSRYSEKQQAEIIIALDTIMDKVRNCL
ncbi:hypothetical protein HZF08_02160 [Paenibacillus sp. CGMCC 1.16610]|uniref:Uncharacterized protein n=1 Tax=Paenibacillus anseongense TaxID=2682845 RepID=A0ABW9U311_9BACL|nr:MULTISPECIES: hypothetical protein [Paenibacillus]MBA2937104.1 hypothetical protein [Paenibacillus sp. CGMCC 1.16610]MVQ33426.1 hypothetical protein [Paenibacillus anseongense]